MANILNQNQILELYKAETTNFTSNDTTVYTTMKLAPTDLIIIKISLKTEKIEKINLQKIIKCNNEKTSLIMSPDSEKYLICIRHDLMDHTLQKLVFENSLKFCEQKIKKNLNYCSNSFYEDSQQNLHYLDVERVDPRLLIKTSWEDLENPIDQKINLEHFKQRKDNRIHFYKEKIFEKFYLYFEISKKDLQEGQVIFAFRFFEIGKNEGSSFIFQIDEYNYAALNTMNFLKIGENKLLLFSKYLKIGGKKIYLKVDFGNSECELCDFDDEVDNLVAWVGDGISVVQDCQGEYRLLVV